jgi:hypothetical protein
LFFKISFCFENFSQAKNELQKLKEYSKKFDKNEDFDDKIKQDIRKVDNTKLNLELNNKDLDKRRLLYNDIYRMVPYKDLHSDLIFKKNNTTKVVKKVDETLNLFEIAKRIVSSVLEDSVHELTIPEDPKSSFVKYDSNFESGDSESDISVRTDESEELELVFEDESFQY